MQSNSDGNGRVALVTGAGSGVGRAAAVALGRTGHALVLAGRRKQPLEETAALAADAGAGRALAVATDVSVAEDVDALFDAVGRDLGRLDVLFNNAGVGTPAVPLEDLEVADWCRCVAVNLTGAFLCSRRAMGLMKSQEPRGGRIINNGSVSAHAPRPHTAAYTATKHAITGLTKSISLDGRAHGIACSQIDIGNADTPMTERMRTGTLQADGSTAAEPVFDVAHCGDAIAFMASLPLDANVQFMTIMATRMPYVGRG